MDPNTSAIVGWVVAVGFLVILGVLVVVGWRLFRRRRREELRTELADQLREAVQRLGLGTVWETPLFQADVYGIRGSIDEFDVRAELWDKSSRDFFRLTVHFPHPTAQTFRLMTRRRRGVEHLWRIEPVEIGDPAFDNAFYVYGRRDDQKRVARLFDHRLRKQLLVLRNQVDGLKLGNHSLYVHVDEMVEPSVVVEMIEQAVQVATRVCARAAVVGSREEERKMEYATASMEMLSRDSEHGHTEVFPEGTDQHLAAGDDQGSESDSSSSDSTASGSGSASSTTDPAGGGDSGSSSVSESPASDVRD